MMYIRGERAKDGSNTATLASSAVLVSKCREAAVLIYLHGEV